MGGWNSHWQFISETIGALSYLKTTGCPYYSEFYSLFSKQIALFNAKWPLLPCLIVAKARQYWPPGSFLHIWPILAWYSKVTPITVIAPVDPKSSQIRQIPLWCSWDRFLSGPYLIEYQVFLIIEQDISRLNSYQNNFPEHLSFQTLKSNNGKWQGRQYQQLRTHQWELNQHTVNNSTACKSCSI